MRSDFAFHYQHRVRWVECDPQWVVFNGHYLTFFDVAITEYTRAVGLPSVMSQQQSGAQFFARKATIEYHAPAKYDDLLDICVRLAYLGRSSLRFVIEIYKGEALLTTGELVYVYVDTTVGASVALPEAQRAAILAFEIVPVQLGQSSASTPSIDT
jgi:acyl-CoA thioester hydrolase